MVCACTTLLRCHQIWTHPFDILHKSLCRQSWGREQLIITGRISCHSGILGTGGGQICLTVPSVVCAEVYEILNGVGLNLTPPTKLASKLAISIPMKELQTSSQWEPTLYPPPSPCQASQQTNVILGVKLVSIYGWLGEHFTQHCRINEKWRLRGESIWDPEWASVESGVNNSLSLCQVVDLVPTVWRGVYRVYIDCCRKRKISGEGVHVKYCDCHGLGRLKADENVRKKLLRPVLSGSRARENIDTITICL